MADAATIPVSLEPALPPAAEPEAPGKRFAYDWRQVERGLPLAEMDAFSAYSGIPVKFLLEVVIPARTLKHRKQRNEPFSAEESDRLARVARLYALAVRVFGADDLACRWLTRPKERFEERTPIEMMRTEASGQQVEEMLYQIDEGVFA